MKATVTIKKVRNGVFWRAYVNGKPVRHREHGYIVDSRTLAGAKHQAWHSGASVDKVIVIR